MSSLTFFTIFSGLGFGLLAFLGLGMPGVTGGSALAFFSIALLFAVGGQISSVFRLGHHEPVSKSFRQWPNSWHSRDAWCAITTILLMTNYAAGLIIFDQRWVLLGVLGTLTSLGTVFTNSMIYGQLETVPRWNNPFTPANFLSLSIAGGALLSGEVNLAILFLLIAGGIQIATWMHGDVAFKKSSAGSGNIHALELHNSEPYYLPSEFIHIFGCQHAKKLRFIAILLMVVIPIILLLLPFTHLLALFAVLSHIAGVFISRWLFFAEAENVAHLPVGDDDVT